MSGINAFSIPPAGNAAIPTSLDPSVTTSDQKKHNKHTVADTITIAAITTTALVAFTLTSLGFYLKHFHQPTDEKSRNSDATTSHPDTNVRHVGGDVHHLHDIGGSHF